MSFSVSGPKILFRIDLGFVQIPITQTTLSSFVVMVLLMIACILCGRNLKKRPGKRQVIVEKLVTMLYNMVEDTMGAHNMRFAPYMGVLFLSSLFGSLIGTTGFFRSSTADLSTTATWAIMTMLIVWYSNIREQGFFGWLKSFTDPFPVMTPLNIISEFASPISMAFRHFGNVAGGLVLTSLIYAALALLSSALFGWLPGILGKIPFLQIGIPAVLSVYFDFFSGAIQALVLSVVDGLYRHCQSPQRCLGQDKLSGGKGGQEGGKGRSKGRAEEMICYCP